MGENLSAVADHRLIVYCPPDIGYEGYDQVLSIVTYEFDQLTDSDIEQMTARIEISSDKKKRKK